MRDLSKKAKPDISILNANTNNELFNLHLKVITYFFGGSANAAEVDKGRPVNAKLIRGHLRFWWRTCNAHRFKNIKEMYEREEDIWGSTSKPSKIDLAVNIKNNGETDNNWTNERNLSYVLFPFQAQNRGAIPAKQALRGVEFDLIITPSQGIKKIDEDVKKEIEGALWAWVMFGGIGSRTRRGCGSMICNNKPDWNTGSIPQKMNEYVSGSIVNPNLGVPMLKGAKFFTADKNDAKNSWVFAISQMQNFRQGENIGRNPGSDPARRNVLGRSRWPEPDSIRKITGRSCSRHRPVHPAMNYFPRADLGLPIIFHFKDERAGDPSDTTLETNGDGISRMSSPFILKAAPGISNKYNSLIVLLNVPHVYEKNVVLKNGKHYSIPRNELVDPRKDGNVKPLATKPVREAFVNFISSNGFREVR